MVLIASGRKSRLLRSQVGLVVQPQSRVSHGAVCCSAGHEGLSGAQGGEGHPLQPSVPAAVPLQLPQAPAQGGPELPTPGLGDAHRPQRPPLLHRPQHQDHHLGKGLQPGHGATGTPLSSCACPQFSRAPVLVVLRGESVHVDVKALVVCRGPKDRPVVFEAYPCTWHTSNGVRSYITLTQSALENSLHCRTPSKACFVLLSKKKSITAT